MKLSALGISHFACSSFSPHVLFFSETVYWAIKFFLWSLNCGPDGLTLHLMSVLLVSIQQTLWPHVPVWPPGHREVKWRKKKYTEGNTRTRLEPHHQTFLLPCSTSRLDESSHCLSTEPKPRLHAFREVSKHSGFLKGKTCCWWKLKGATNPLRDNLCDRKNQGRSSRRSLPLQSRGFCWNKNSKCGCCSFTKMRQDSTIKRLANTDTKGFSLLLVGFDNGTMWRTSGLAPHITRKQLAMENCDWITISVTDRKFVEFR